MSVDRAQQRPRGLRFAAPLLLVLVSLVAAGSAVWHTPDARLGEVARLESLERARSICRSWLEESISKDFLERCLEGEHSLVEHGGDLLRWVARPRPHGFELDLTLETAGHQHAFRAELAVGRLPGCFSYAFVSDVPVPPGLLRARSDSIARYGPGLPRPLTDADWPDHVALLASRLLRRRGAAGWRLADELPLRHFGLATPRTDYELVSGEGASSAPVRPIQSDERELTVRVPGDLWLGRPRSTTAARSWWPAHS